MTEKNWRKVGTEYQNKWEEFPYRECPNCSRYKFREVKEILHGLPIVGTPRWRYEEICKNCRYRGDEWEEEL